MQRGLVAEIGGKLQVCAPVYQVVDLRTESTVYWNLEDHNRKQKSERNLMIILYSLLSFGVMLIFFPFEDIDEYRKIIWKHRKKKRKKHLSKSM